MEYSCYKDAFDAVRPSNLNVPLTVAEIVAYAFLEASEAEATKVLVVPSEVLCYRKEYSNEYTWVCKATAHKREATPPTLLPADETARLQSLHSYAIVQSLQEEIFDELVALLASLFRLPIAYVGLMEADQLSYKAAYGLPRQSVHPRAGTLCAQVVKYNRVVVYHDLAEAPQTSLDALAIQNSLGHKVRFYAGAPLRMPDHRTIGTLCLASQQPREFSPAEQQ
nr:putative LOV domain-containing protein [Tanacetum cinerariifolium]